MTDAHSAEADGDGTVGPTVALTAAFEASQPEEEAPLKLFAEWALWGKDERNTGYHVMRCSKGHLAATDFSEIITRYGSGVKPSLPQFTMCWIPGPHRGPEYLAVGIHEVIEPGSPSSGGRSRNVGGRVVEYVRMFCFRYADVAEFEASYTQLVKAVTDIPLVTGEDHADLIEVVLPSAVEPIVPADAERQLAEDVALTLLTGSPVCVLDADGVEAERRLAFIDSVLSLLPFGLRATLSASTWASTTLQELKLRLYFSNAPREDRGRTSHVSWRRPGYVRIPEGHEAARLYQEWLRDAGPGAIEDLTHVTAPIRFVEAEELQMLASLPNDKTIAETLEELADRLRAADQRAVSAIVKRLKRYVASPQSSADRAACRALMLEKYHLFREHAKIHGNVKSSVYKTLLSLGFEEPLSYPAYCEIEDSVGRQLGWMLRKVILENKSSPLPYVLVGTAGSEVGYVQLRDSLAIANIRAVRLLDILDRDMDLVHPRHRTDLIDFTLRYLTGSAGLDDQWKTADDPRTALFIRGYLTDLLHRAFPDDRAEQRHWLASILSYVYGKRLGRRQIREIFEAPRLYPGSALEITVRRLARPWNWPLVERQAAAARVRHAGHASDVAKMLRPAGLSMLRLLGPEPDTGSGPGRLIFALLTGLVMAGIVVLVLFLVSQGF